MAIQTLSIISLILRPYVEQPISTDGGRQLFAQVDLYRNFDGELMAFGAMPGQDIDRIIHLVTLGQIKATNQTWWCRTCSQVQAISHLG